MKHVKAVLPILFLFLVAYGGMRAFRELDVHANIGAQCEMKENFAAPGRPVYWHHCNCLGWKYNENPQPAPYAAATRCFGLVKRSWVDTDEIALKEIEERERQAKSLRLFEALPKETQAKVLAAYKRLHQAAFRNDPAYVIEQAKIILLEVDDYGDTRTLEAGARKALEAQKNGPVGLGQPEPLKLDTATETKTETR